MNNRMINIPETLAGKNDNIKLINPLGGNTNTPRMKRINKIIINGITNLIIFPKFIV